MTLKPLLFMTLLLLLAYSLPAAAQDTPYVHVIDQGAKTVYRIGFDGSVTAIPLNVPAESYSRRFAVSEDGRFLATCYLPTSGTAVTQLVIDLSTGAEVMRNTFEDVRDCEAGAFNEDNSRVAFGFINYNPVFDANADQSQPAWDLRVYDMATGSEVARLDALSNPNAEIVAGVDAPVMPVPLRIVDGVVEFFGSARGMEISSTGVTYRWIMDDGRVNRVEYPGQASFEMLPNGESVWLDVNHDLPQTNPSTSFIPPYNVVMVHQRTSRESGILYYANQAWLTDAVFINGGRDVVASVERPNINDPRQPFSELIKISRDGSTETLEFSGTALGTMDGFVVLSRESLEGNHAIYHLRYIAGEAVSELWQSEPTASAMTLIHAEPMFLAENLPPFPLLNVAEIDTTVRCDGVNASRLSRGQIALITSRSAHSLRQAPAIDAGLWGEIPSGGQIRMLDGPHCDDTGRTWWYINYQGQDGWIVEIEDGIYTAEPLDG